MFELVRTWRFLRALIAITALPEGRSLLVLLALQLLGGSVFYAAVEDWPWLDALYFCVMSVTTVGFGDLHPTTDLSKAFTILYVFVGVGFMLSFVALIGSHIGAWEKPTAPRRPDID